MGKEKEKREKEEDSSDGKPMSFFHLCCLMNCMLAACAKCLGWSSDQDDLKDHLKEENPRVKEDEMKANEDGSRAVTLTSRRPRKPGPDPGRGGQTNRDDI